MVRLNEYLRCFGLRLAVLVLALVGWAPVAMGQAHAFAPPGPPIHAEAASHPMAQVGLHSKDPGHTLLQGCDFNDTCRLICALQAIQFPVGPSPEAPSHASQADFPAVAAAWRPALNLREGPPPRS